MLHKIINKGSVASLISQGISSFSNFLTVVILTKTLSPHDFGFYMMLNTALLIIGSISVSLVRTPLRFLGGSTKEEDASSYYSSQLSLQIFIDVILTLIGLLFLSFTPLIGLGIAAAFFLCLISADLQDFTRAANTTLFNWGSLIRADIITYSCRIFLLLILIWFESVSLASILVVIGATYLIGFLTKPLGGVNFHIDYQSVVSISRMNWKFGKWLLMESIVFTTSTQIYIYFIALGVDVVTAGAFAAVQTLLGSLNVVLIGSMNYAIPVARKHLCNDGFVAWRRWLLSIGILLFSVSCLFCTAISIFAKPLLSFLFKPIYSNYYYLAPILGIVIVLTSINSVLSAAFRTAEAPQVGFWGKCLSAVITIILGYPLIMKWGAMGAGIGMVFTQICWILVNFSYIFFSNTLSAEQISTRIFKHTG